MKQKLFTLLTLALLGISSAWADDAISCSAYLSGTAGTPTTTDCTLAYYSSEGNASTIPAGTQVGTTSYYKEKINGDANYYVVTLNKTVGVKTYTKFIAGDVITVYLNANSGTQAYKVGKTAQTAVSASNSKNTNAVYGVDHALTAAEIETDGSLRIYRNSSNTHFAGISVAGTRSLKTPVTLSFASASGSFDVNAASPSLPAVTSDPNVTAVTDNIAYSSSNSAVAIVNTSTGALTLKGIGTTTITASFAGDATYQAAEAEYTLTVTDATKLGYAEVLNPDNKTLAARWLFGIDHASVAQTYGSKMTDYASRSVTVYLNGTAASNQYTNTNTWYKTVNTSAYDADQWMGYDITVDDGYVLNLSNIDARLIVSDDCTITWKVVIEDKNGTEVYASGNKTTSRSATGTLNEDLTLSNLTGTVHVKVMMYQGGSTKGYSMDKFILTGATAVDSREEHTITFAAGEGSGTAPADVTVRDGETYFFPKAPLLYKTGNTLTDWNDGTSDHKVGSSATISDDTDLTAVFTPNTVALGNVATTVDWTFKTDKGAPTIAIEGGGSTPVVYSSRTTIDTTPYDALMTIDATSGKFNNTSNATYAQVAAGTKFTIPAVNGMVVTVSCNQNPGAVTDVTFDGNNADEFSTDPRTLTYTYSGSASTIDIVVANGGLYPDGISVAYPYVKSKYDAPTITVGDFDFENKGYKVTITASEGDLKVSTDGSNYSAQTSPYTTYASTTTHYYAKATGASYSDSDVADENVTNSFDGGKKYVAWVYESNYANAAGNYNIATDAIHTALGTVYNVVNVDIKDYKSAMTDEQKAILNGNLDDADLVVLSEAATGGSKAVIGLKDIVGGVPMLSMKLYAYTYNSTPSNNRWGWGTPKNADNNVDAITPASKFYKVLNGVIFDGNDVALFSYPNDQKHIQYVDSWTAEPAGDVVLATITVSSVAKPVMHASTSQKYFALGLSCDDFTKYNSNAIAIVKNAAAMLIAGENLGAEMTTVTATVGANGYTTFASSYPLDLTDANRPVGLKAYKATRDGANLTFTALNQTVPAGTGLLLLGETKGGNYDIPVAASGDAVSSNALVGVIAPTAKQSDPSGNYYFVMKKAASESDALAFAPLSTSAVTIPAGKAYVEVPNSAFSGPANELTISFEEDGDVTGISEMKAMRNVGRETFFDLQGRQVTQPTKGLYIVNGKKVVLK